MAPTKLLRVPHTITSTRRNSLCGATVSSKLTRRRRAKAVVGAFRGRKSRGRRGRGGEEGGLRFGHRVSLRGANLRGRMGVKQVKKHRDERRRPRKQIKLGEDPIWVPYGPTRALASAKSAKRNDIRLYVRDLFLNLWIDCDSF